MEYQSRIRSELWVFLQEGIWLLLQALITTTKPSPIPKGLSLRPDFLILVYPVISFDPEIGHSGSAQNLLGENPTQALRDFYSNEKQVNSNTPPTYLVHAKNDPVSVQNSYVFEEALKKFNIPVSTTYFEEGGHGFGMINRTSDVKWMDEVEKWLKAIIVD
jgi:acetyl esterase/lipase